jgi:hypothetical protein
MLEKNSPKIQRKTNNKREPSSKSPPTFLSPQKHDHLKTLTPSPADLKEKAQKSRKTRAKNDSKPDLDAFLHRKIATRAKSEQNLERQRKQETFKPPAKLVKFKAMTKDEEIREFNKNIKKLRTLFGKKKHSELFINKKNLNKRKSSQLQPKALKQQKTLKKRLFKEKNTLKTQSSSSNNLSILRKSAIKIQSCFRGYLIRKLFKTCLKQLTFEYPKTPSFSFSYIQNSIDAFIDPGDVPTPSFYSKSFSESSPATRLKILIHKKSILSKLEAEDVLSIQEALKPLNYSQEKIQIFLKIISRRYQKLHAFFDEWLLKLKESLKYLIKIESSSQSIHLSRKEINHRVRNPSEELCLDIENLWEKIEDFQGQRNFLSSYPDSLNTFHIIDQTELRVSSRVVVESSSNSTIMTFSKPEENEAAEVSEFSGNSAEKRQKEVKLSFINIVQGSSSMSLEHSKALKDYSSILNVPDEGVNESNSLQNELDLKPRQRQTMWPSKSRSIFECESASNPLSGTSHLIREYDASEVNLVLDRTLLNLEFIIFHEIIEDHCTLLSDTNFILRLCEDFLLKLISNFTNEAVRPRVVRQSTRPQVKTDTLTLLKHLDVVFTKNLETLSKFQEKLLKIFGFEAISSRLRTNSAFSSKSLFTLKSKSEGLIAIHQKSIIQACSELLISKLSSSQAGLFDLVLWKLPNLRLADLLVEIRDTLENWNEFKAGTLPMGDTIRANGELDEVKLFSKRKESLNLLIFDEILSEDKDWTELFLYEEQEILVVEEKVLEFLFEELESLLRTF